jgi:hypothetical protein
MPPRPSPDPVDSAYPPALSELIGRAHSRIRRGLKRGAPTLSVHALAWMRSLAGGAQPEAYFTHRNAFPMLLLPWWLEAGVRDAPDRAFHCDVVYSTLNGYYFVRMIDDLMDGERPPGPTAIPAMILFHTEFVRTYHRHFPHGHPFWDTLVGESVAAAETASSDAGMSHVDRAAFLATSARKIAGAKIPIAAVCHRYDRADLLGPWFELVDRLGRWHQMLNDIRGWSSDLERGRMTYFLTEAAARAGPSRSIAEWVIADGLAWGMAELDAWMDELMAAAAELESPPLVAYLDARRRSLVLEWEGLAASLPALARLAATLR